MALIQSKVEFDPILHEYHLDGKPLIGVTALMKKHGLAVDYTGISDEVLARAAERGTAVHRLLEDYDNGHPVIETPDLKAYKELHLPVICSEYLVSDNELVASSVDKVMFSNYGSTVDIADVKTTSTFHKEQVSVQLGIYAYLLELQNPGLKVHKCYGIHVRDGRARLIEVPRWPEENVRTLLEAERMGLPYTEDMLPVHIEDAVGQADADMLVQGEVMLASFKDTIKGLEEKMKEARERLLDYMMANNLKEVLADGACFRLKDAYTTERIDSARLRKDYPDIASAYTKTSTTRASVMFTMDKK